MRFQRLHVPAFGPFTHLELNFPKKDRDLHVIYGDNEAGKSSLLRAIRDLLFGIPGQSPDNFLHDYKNLRLMGEIANHAGKELIFQRRKG
ncbi:MAG: AAA family ATPase, partial [Planctomycetes bacterium]|nr:AAA family ATPase [Planctomycetota bacterium]